LPIEFDTVSRPLGRRREPVVQFQRMRQEAFAPEAVDLKIRTVRESGQQLDRDIMSTMRSNRQIKRLG
jgi:hypothetical protein